MLNFKAFNWEDFNWDHSRTKLSYSEVGICHSCSSIRSSCSRPPSASAMRSVKTRSLNSGRPSLKPSTDQKTRWHKLGGWNWLFFRLIKIIRSFCHFWSFFNQLQFFERLIGNRVKGYPAVKNGNWKFYFEIPRTLSSDFVKKFWSFIPTLTLFVKIIF